MAGKLGKTDICNIALRRLGVRPVNNVESDTSNPAVELRAVWDLSVESVLRLSEWNFATKIIALALLTDETVIGWDFLYTYPSDCVMAWKLETAESMRNPTITYDWEEVLSPSTGVQSIATNLENAYLRYIARVNDPTKWDMTFINALAWRLALETCQRLNADASIFQKCTTMYAQAASEAQTMNKVENKSHTPHDSPYLEVR